MNADWLKLVCGKNQYRSREVTAAPRTVFGWAMWTDGHVAVAIRNPDVFPPPDPDPIAQVEGWLNSDTSGGALITAQQFRDFAGKYIPTKECAGCDGAGKVTCQECDGEGQVDCECSKCGDEHASSCSCENGKIDCKACGGGRGGGRPAAHGRVNGLLINRNLLAAPAAFLPDGDIHVLTAGADKMVTFDGGDWRIFIMPMRDYGNVVGMVPELIPEKVETK